MDIFLYEETQADTEGVVTATGKQRKFVISSTYWDKLHYPLCCLLLFRITLRTAWVAIL